MVSSWWVVLLDLLCQWLGFAHSRAFSSSLTAATNPVLDLPASSINVLASESARFWSFLSSKKSMSSNMGESHIYVRDMTKDNNSHWRHTAALRYRSVLLNQIIREYDGFGNVFCAFSWFEQDIWDSGLDRVILPVIDILGFFMSSIYFLLRKCYL